MDWNQECERSENWTGQREKIQLRCKYLAGV